MSIISCIESLTRIDNSKNVQQNVKWQKKSKPKPSSYRGRGFLPHQFEFDQTEQNAYHQRDKKYNSTRKTKYYQPDRDSTHNYGDHRFAEIAPSVREVGKGYNTFSNSAIERRYKEKQSNYVPVEKSNSNTTYATAISKSTDESFNTPSEALGSLKLSSDELKNDVSSGDSNEVLDISNERSLNISLDTESDEESWDKNESDESMYQRRIMRFFQSAEDEDVYCHPLMGVQKDPEWQKYQLRRKGVQVVETPRQHYLNLEDKDFGFEMRKIE